MADQPLTGGPEAMLEQCRHCPSQLAHPLRWRRLALDAWEIELRCPDCRQVWYERVPTAAVKRLDRVLKAARTELEKHLEEIDRIDFQDQVEDFISALNSDAILPEDFRASPSGVGYVPAVEIDGRYRLEDRIGSGGTGEVWRAVDERLNRVVAIKLLHPWVAQATEGRERFRREAAAMGRLKHPHIVQVLEFNDTAERPYLVQEHCPGGTLGPLVGGGPMPWDRARALARPIAAALAHAHGQGVIHRDLKPSNVLFAEGGRVVVGDFGLARLLATSDGTLTATGMRMGSPEYWSPEQAAGDAVSERADVYALGCILYHLVSGALPFPGEDRLAAGYRRVQEDATPLPDAGGALIARMMERDPSRRPRAEDVLEMLDGRRATDETQVTAPPPPPEETLRLLPPTLVAPPLATATATRPAATMAREPEPVVIPAGNEPVAPLQYPGVRTGGAVGSILLGATAVGIASVAGESSTAVDVDRAGLVYRSELASDDAIAALVVLGGAAILTLALVWLAIWAARQSGRARMSFVRGLLGLIAVIVSCLAAGALVWTANAATAAGISSLITDAGF